MFTRKTMLILGDGSTIDIGYPTGEQLITDICDLLSSKINNNRYNISAITIEGYLFLERIKQEIHEDKASTKFKRYLVKCISVIVPFLLIEAFKIKLKFNGK